MADRLIGRQCIFCCRRIFRHGSSALANRTACERRFQVGTIRTIRHGTRHRYFGHLPTGYHSVLLLILNVSEPAIGYIFQLPLDALGLDPSMGSTVAFVIALLLVTFLHVTLGEMVPKNAAVSMADRAVLVLAPPL